MDIRELEIFLTTAELLHFGRASQTCNLSPSALTRTIQRLEEQLGQALFLRDNRTVQLSRAGEQFCVYARQAVLDFQSFQASLTGSQKFAGTLSLYASITAVYSLLPNLLEVYRKAYPAVQLELHTGAADKAVLQVESGEIDIAVAALPDRRSAGIEFLPIMTTPLIFIAGKQLAASIGQIDSQPLDLAQVPLVLPQAGLSRRRLDGWLKKNRIVPKISSEVSGNEAIIPMVHLGGGVGIVPQLVLERSPFCADVVILDQMPQLEPYVVGLCSSRKNLQKVSVKAFWQLAENQSN
ncbi:MAG: HTH-type transcriptional activator IlvY [Thermodesulfobacteriota bacterium]|nr:HTH-type transcriptional activator IlvY [Thermodesulfobacteriota bacterium]